MQGTIEHWLRLGLGRAFLALREDPSLAPPEMILEACLHNQARDRQLEGSRAEYMYAILELYRNDQPRWDFFRNALVEALLAFDNTSEDYDVQQVYLLVNRYADDDDQAAKQALYQHFDRFPHLAQYVGAQVLIALDGTAGFVHAVERIQDTIPPDIDQYDRSYITNLLLRELEDQLGVEAAHTEFDRLRTTNAKIDHFFRPNPEPPRPREARKKVPYSEIQVALRSKHHMPISPFEWAKEASPSDLEMVAEDLINRTTPPLFLLKVLRGVEFPRDPALLMPFTRDANNQIRAAAFCALERLTHPTIRTFALECIDADHEVGRAVRLLEKYLESTDWPLFERLSQREMDAEAYHSLAFALWELCETHPSPDAAPILLQLYERTHCAYCRERIVNALHKLHALPAWMKEECRYDSSSDVREWAEEISAEV